MERKMKRKIALIILIVMIANIFSPYSILIKKVEAATDIPPDPVLVFNKIQDLTDKNGNKIFKVQIAVVGDVNLNGIDVKLGYDNTKIQPANKSTGKATTSIGLISETYPDMADGSYGKKEYDATTEKYRIVYAKGGGHDLPECAYSAGEGWEDVYLGYDTWAADFDYYLPIITYTFRLVDTTLTDDDITTDLFSLTPVTGSLPTGAQIVYKNTSGTSVAYNIDKISGVGFAQASKTVSSIAVKTNPTKMDYEHGDAINLAGGEITVTYDDNSTEDVSMIDSKVSIVSGSTANINDNKVVISYIGKQAEFNVNVSDPVQELKIVSTMNRLEYNHGDDIDFTGMQLQAVKKSGATETVVNSNNDLLISEITANINSSNFTKTSADGDVVTRGTQKLVYTYFGKSVNQTIVVNDTIDNIELSSQPNKVVYKIGESINLSGAIVKVNLASGATTNINLPDGGVTVGSYSSTTTGSKQNLSVSYSGKTASQTINVEFYNYVSTSTLTDPLKVTYKYNEELNLAGGKLTLNWKSGTIKDVALTSDMVTGYNKQTIGTQTITVKYNLVYTLSDSTTVNDSITKTYEVEVENPVTVIAITAPTKTTYNHGDSLSFTGGKVTKTFADGTTSDIAINASMVTENGGAVNMSPSASEYVNNKVSKTLKIKYTEDSITEEINYPITIINDVKSISIHTVAKTEYNVNDLINIADGEILVTRATGTPEVLSMSDSKVSVTGFNSTAEHTNLPITVTYTENGVSKQTTYNVNVADSVKSVVIKTAPKVDYKYNEELSVTGGEIEVEKGSGKITIPITSSMITGYNKTTLGEQTLTVTYGGQTATYKVTVKDYVTGISVAPNSVTGKYNDELSSLITTNNIKYEVTYASAGAKPKVALTESMVTGYSKISTSAQSLTVTYTDSDANSATNGQTFTTTLNVSLSNPVTAITITAPTKTTYNHGDSLSFTGGKVTKTYADGKTADIAVNASMVTENGGAVNMSPSASEYVNNKVSKTLKIKYTEDSVTEEISYSISILNPIDKIDIATAPKIAYTLNEIVTGIGGTLTVTRKAGNTETINIEDAMVSNLNTSVAGTGKTATVTYTEDGITKTTTFTYDVVDNIDKIEIIAPSKTTYNHGETLDLTGGTITVFYSSGTTSNVTMEANMITENSGTVNMSPLASEYDSTNKISKGLVITYTENGKIATTNYNVTIINDIKSIKITTTPKTEYVVNEVLDLTSGKIEIQRAVGPNEEISMNNANVVVSNFDSTSEISNLKLKVEYTENSITKQDEYEINVTDPISSVVIKDSPKIVYKYGEDLSVTGGTLEIQKASGKVTIPMTDTMVTGYDSETLGEQTLTVTYGGQTVTYKVTVKDYVTGIVITKNPDKVKYEYGDSLVLDGLEITKQMKSGATEVISMPNSNVSINGFDATNVGTQNIEVTYDGYSDSFNIEVEDNIQSIAINTMPETEYKYGKALDISSGKISVNRSSGSEIKDITSSMVTGYDPTKLGKQTLTITYGEKTTTYDVNVSDYEVGIEIVAPTKIAYKLNETPIDLTGGTVAVKMASGIINTPIDMTSAMITGFDSSSEGTKTITVTYQGFIVKFNVTVQDMIGNVSIDSYPRKNNYDYGEALDITGGKLVITKESGNIEYINITKDMVSGYNPNKLGEQTVTISYNGTQVGNYIVNVNDYIKSIKVQKPNNVEYEYGESLDLTGGRVSVIMASGKVDETVDLTASMLTTVFDKNKVGNQVINVEYKGKYSSFSVNVVDKVNGISISSLPNKLTYKYGESLDLSGGMLTVIKSSGTTTIPITLEMITGFDSKSSGTQIITVTYGSLKTNFVITVEKEEVKHATTNNSTTIVIKPDNTNANTNTNTNTEENEEIKSPDLSQETPINEENNERTQPEESYKKDETKKDKIKIKEKCNNDNKVLISGFLAGMALLFIILLLVFKHNVKIYVEENEEFVLGGLDKLSKNKLTLDVDKYLDIETYPNNVRIVLNDIISEKLDGKEIEITHRRKVQKYKIKYEDKPFEIILKKELKISTKVTNENTK